MTAYSYVQAPCFTAGRGGYRIDRIILHHWDDPAKNPAFDGVVWHFRTGKAQTSIHYVVEAGRVCQMVSENDTAWHAGNFNVNQRSIGIECNPRASEEDKRTIAELIRQIRSRHGNIPVYGHKDVIPTACPGRYYPPAQVLAPYLNGTAPAQPAPAPAPTGNLEALADAVMRGDYGNGEERIRRLGANYQAVQDIINRRLYGSPAPRLDLNALADAVIRGDYGNGEERKRRLGNNYQAVQDIVNKRLYG